MTIYAILYLIPAFAGYYWSFRLLFCKEKVMSAQWILMGGVFLTSVAATLYSTYFNTHFQKEHILCFLYTSTAVITPPVFTFGILNLNQGQGVPLRNRLIFIPSVLNIASIFLIGTLGGLKRYQRFLATAVHGGDLSLQGDFWYDAMIIIGYYGFLLTLVLSVIGMMVIIAPRIKEYIEMMENNFATPPRSVRRLNRMMVTLGIFVVMVAVVEGAFPLHKMTSVTVVVIIAIVQFFILYTVGRCVYNISFTAEQLARHQRDTEYIREQYQKISKTVSNDSLEHVYECLQEYMVQGKGFLDPHVSVFKIANHYHIDQHLIVRVINEVLGSSFSEYVNSMRIEYAIGLVLERNDEGKMAFEDSEEEGRFIDNLAYTCGYPSRASFYLGFNQVMGRSFTDWLKEL